MFFSKDKMIHNLSVCLWDRIHVSVNTISLSVNKFINILLSTFVVKTFRQLLLVCSSLDSNIVVSRNVEVIEVTTSSSGSLN